MAANNETGAIQPLLDVAAAVPDTTRLHTDAVQAFISEPVTVATTGAGMISLAAHKLGGPKGAGLLYVRDGIELEQTVNRLGGEPRGLRQSFRSPSGGRRQNHPVLLAAEDLDDTADECRLTGSRSAGDDHDFLSQRGSESLPLTLGKLDIEVALIPGE